MRRTSRSLVAAACLLAAGTLGTFASTGHAQVGTAITYQGLLERNGVKVATATDMRFTLFDAATAGNAVGNVVTLNAQQVSNGLFNVALDFGVNPYTAGAARWMQIEVRNPAGNGSFVPMGARQKLTPSPFSLATRGIEVDSADNVAITKNKVIKTTGPTGGRLHIQSGNDGTFDGLYLNPFPNGGNVYLGNGAGAANLICYDKVGIGVNPPVFPLEVSGRVKVRAGASGSAGIWYTDDDAPATDKSFVGRGSPTDRWTGVFSVQTGSWPMVIKDSGNVGIGTSTPGEKLDVAGNIKIRTNDRLYFGAPGEDTDTFYLSRFRFAADENVLELALGDNASATGNDAFIITTRDAGGNGARNTVFQFNSSGIAQKPGGGSWTNLSDARAKHDIQAMTGTLDRLLQLKGHSYTYKPEFVENGRALPGTQIGLVAQEVETVFPDWVTTGSDGLKVVTERSTTALMVEAMRDLRAEKDAEIKTLEARLEKLEALLSKNAGK